MKWNSIIPIVMFALVLLVASACGGAGAGPSPSPTPTPTPTPSWPSDALWQQAISYLEDNPDARDPSWDDVKQFLWEDNTDALLLPRMTSESLNLEQWSAVSNTILHNNAERAGIRAGFAAIKLNSFNLNPYLTVFNTTDEGLVYIGLQLILYAPEAEEAGCSISKYRYYVDLHATFRWEQVFECPDLFESGFAVLGDLGGSSGIVMNLAVQW